MPIRTLESDFKKDILKFVATLKNVNLFNNPIGQAWSGKTVKRTGTTIVLAFARRIAFGVFGAGGSDLIGWKTITITASMVGQRVAVFHAVELKNPNGTGRTTPEQLDIISLVNNSGGRGAIINSIQEFRNFIGEE